MKIYPVTPDGRYFVVKRRLWRCTNPALSPEVRQDLVQRLMEARRNKGVAIRKEDISGRERARQTIEQLKCQLGERGPVWWTDGEIDWNRHMVENSPYAEWFIALDI